MKFRTVDSLNFDMIATMDIERTIVDLAVDPNDNYISLVVEENAEIQSCRLYEVGRKKRHDGDLDGMNNKEETDSDDDDVDSDDDDQTDDYISDTDDDIDGDYLYDIVDDVLGDGNVDIPNGEMFEAILTSGDDDDPIVEELDMDDDPEFEDDIDE
jgi:phosphopantothenoylcysteine synthetase/decarboxylase